MQCYKYSVEYRRSGPQDAQIDNLALRAGDTACTLASYQTSVLYLSVPQVSSAKVPCASVQIPCTNAVRPATTHLQLLQPHQQSRGTECSLTCRPL